MENILWLDEETLRARIGVCRRADGMSVGDIEAALADAEGYAAEAEAEVRQPSPGRPSFMPDPEVEAADCAARVAEWRHVLDLTRAQNWESYVPARDEVGSRCAADYESWRQSVLTRARETEQRQRDAVHELNADIRLNATIGRRIRSLSLSQRYGITPEQLLTQLAGQAVMTGDGTVAVEPFTPS
ncbi:hypothetical protein [Streptomyces sp. NBC_00690]|uniref:hypothetical protein n=1 Tax=Streptomyces sp. NBC_00690 TaxID=2975808 RepID=UPI002E283806|nr:hypothetical protein [Streptomyces sp. NBC_00690]